MSLEFEKKVPHHEWDEMELSITDSYQLTDTPRLTISINDGGGVCGNASRITLTTDELNTVIEFMRRYDAAKKIMEGVS